MPKRYVLSLFLLGCTCAIVAQQVPQYSLVQLNRFAYNPAYAGLDNSLSITGVYRKQWVDIPGSPSTYNVTAHLPLYFTNGGLGFQLESETLGVNDVTFIGGAYTQYLELSRRAVLSIGVGAGYYQRTIDGSRLRTQTGLYGPEFPGIDHRDPILPITRVQGGAPTFRAGVYLQTENLQIGLSSIHLAEQAVEFDQFTFQLGRHYLLTATYGLDLTRRVRLEPTAVLKSTGDVHQAELSVLARYNENVFGGLGYRGYNAQSQDAVVFLLGFKLGQQLHFGYAYDLSMGAVQTVSNGSHEIVINYNFGRPIGQGRPPKVIYNPRNL